MDETTARDLDPPHERRPAACDLDPEGPLFLISPNTLSGLAERDQRGQILVPGVVVQIDPRMDEVFGGCLLIVDKIVWGWNVVRGYVPMPDGKLRYHRCRTNAVVCIGEAAWEWEYELTLGDDGPTPAVP